MRRSGGKKKREIRTASYSGVWGGKEGGGLLQSLPLTKDMTNTEQGRIQTFQIPFAGVRIRATYVEN